MKSVYNVIASPHFQRQFKKIKKKDPNVKENFLKLVEILEFDPKNSTTRFNIKKLVGVPKGEGEWRIRMGSYRVRYSIDEKEKKIVILLLIGLRKDIYKL